MANTTELMNTISQLTDALASARADNTRLKTQVEDFCEEMHKSYKQQRKELRDLNSKLETLRTQVEGTRVSA